MANWTTIPDDVLEPGKPIRSVDALALRDNPVAIAAGAANAPRVQTAAIQNSAVTNAKLANSSVTSAKLATSERMTTANVLARTAGASVGAVGTYAWLGSTKKTAVAAGSTKAGSALRYAGIETTDSFTGNTLQTSDFTGNGGTPAGTWRAMGRDNSRTISFSPNRFGATLWLRIS